MFASVYFEKISPHLVEDNQSTEASTDEHDENEDGKEEADEGEEVLGDTVSFMNTLEMMKQANRTIKLCILIIKQESKTTLQQTYDEETQNLINGIFKTINACLIENENILKIEQKS